MNNILRNILLLTSLLFFVLILNMVIKRKLELKYVLTWLFTSITFVIITLFPNIVYSLSQLLHIINPVNALFLIIIFLLLMIVFTLTVALSRNSNRVKTLVQEVGILRNSLENLKQQNNNNKQ